MTAGTSIAKLPPMCSSLSLLPCFESDERQLFAYRCSVEDLFHGMEELRISVPGVTHLQIMDTSLWYDVAGHVVSDLFPDMTHISWVLPQKLSIEEAMNTAQDVPDPLLSAEQVKMAVVGFNIEVKDKSLWPALQSRLEEHLLAATDREHSGRCVVALVHNDMDFDDSDFWTRARERLTPFVASGLSGR